MKQNSRIIFGVKTLIRVRLRIWGRTLVTMKALILPVCGI